MFKQLRHLLYLVATLLFVPTALANNSVDQGAGAAQPSGTPSSLIQNGTNAQGQTVHSIFSTVANILIFIVGAVAVIVLIIGGLRYVISQGSSDQVKQAKDTILYGIIGVVVAILAYAAVNFVTGHLH